MDKILSDPTKLSQNPAHPSKVNFMHFRKSSSPQKKGNPVKLAISTSERPKFDLNPNQDTGQGTQSATNSKLNHMSDISPRNLQIFKHSLQSKGEYPRLDATVKPAVGPNQIKRDDSPSLVKYIIEKANEGNRIAKKDKTHGIMYINELWDGNYERKTMKATKVSGAMIRLGRLGRQSSGRDFAKQGGIVQVDTSSKKSRKQDTVFKLQIHPDEGEIMPPPQINNQYDGNSEREPSSKTSTLVIDPTGKPANLPGIVPPLKRHSSLPKMLNLQLLSAPKSSIGGSNTARSSSPREGPNVSISPRGKDMSSPCSARLKKDDVSLTQTTKNSELITQKTMDSFGRVHNRTKSEKMILTNFHEKLEVNMPLVKTELSTRRSSNQYTVDSPTTVREAKKAKLFIQNKGQDLSELIDKCKSELEGRNEWLKNFEKVFSSTKSSRKREMENNKNLDVFKFSKASLMH